MQNKSPKSHSQKKAFQTRFTATPSPTKKKNNHIDAPSRKLAKTTAKEEQRK
jgi:hypothetical protein